MGWDDPQANAPVSTERPPEMSSPGLRVFLFGQPRVLHRGVPCKLKNAGGTLPLLAYLLLNRERPSYRTHVASVLWPDEADDEARDKLRRYIYHLRSSLPQQAEWIRTTADTVQWNLAAPFWCDVAAFERCVRDGTALEEAVAAYGGDLAENRYDDWLFAHRERLRSDYLASLSALAERCRAARAYDDALGWTRKLLAADPLREDVVRTAMTIRYESGDRAGALREHDAFAQLVQRELGVDPMPETEALRARIAAGDALAPAAAPSGAGGAGAEAADAAAPVMPLVGRDDELRVLETAWSRAARGAGGLVLIGGEPGIGKSRLVDELARAAQARGGRVLRGATSFPESAPYQSLTEAVRGALPAFEPHGAQVPDDIALALGELAAAHPLLVVLEDVHWATAATVEAIGLLARHAAGRTMLVVATYRDSEVQRAHALRAVRRQLQQAGACTHVAPRRLSDADVARLVDAAVARIADAAAARTPREAPPALDAASLARCVARRSDGNPLFACELIRDAVERAERGEPYRPRAVPAGVREMIGARIGRLGADARQLAGIAAVAGDAFTVEMLREVSGWDEARVLELVDVLVDRHLVREAPSRNGYDYAFAHHLVRAAVYDALDPDVRARRHRRVALQLEAVRPERAFALEIAAHWERAHEPERAARWMLDAARHALDVFANTEAAELARYALDLTADAAVRCDLLLVAVDAAHRLGELGDERELLVRAESEAAGAGARHAFEVLLRAARCSHRAGSADEDADVHRRLREAADALGDDTVRAGLYAQEAKYERKCGRYESAQELLERADALYERLGAAEPRVDVLAQGVTYAAYVNDARRRDAFLSRLRALDLRGQPALRLRALRAERRLALAVNAPEPLFAVASESLALSREVGDRREEADALLALANAHVLVGAYGDADFDAAIALFEHVGDPIGLSGALHNSAHLLRELGAFDEALARLERALAINVENGSAVGRALCLMFLAATACEAERFAAALDYAERTLEAVDAAGVAHVRAYGLLYRAAACAGLGRFDDARAALRGALGTQTPADQPGERCFFLAACAQAAADAGDFTTARDAFEQAWPLVGGAGALTRRYERVYWPGAQIARAFGDAARAAELQALARADVERTCASLRDERARETFRAIPLVARVLAASRDRSDAVPATARDQRRRTLEAAVPAGRMR
jgi:DNA-binding SARP family transcriptional activator/tetratricopeptide (TPR) repeat protein